MTLWVFELVKDRWKRRSLAWYDRFVSGEEQVIGTRLRFAHVYLEVEKRLPTAVRLIQYTSHELTPEGFIDKEFELATMRDLLDTLPLLPEPVGHNDNVVDASRRFAMRRVENHRWKPTPREVTLLMQKLEALDVPF